MLLLLWVHLCSHSSIHVGIHYHTCDSSAFTPMRFQGLMQHRQKIHNKLVSIMRERLSQSLKSLHSTSAAWAEYEGPGVASAAVNSSKPSSQVQPKKAKAIAKMMSQLVKQVTALNDAISPIMAPSQLIDVGVRIRRMYSESLSR